MPYFDVFSLLDVHKRNGRSRGKRKNGNLKRKYKNRNCLDTYQIYVRSLHMGVIILLSKLSSLSIASLRILDEKANKFHDRIHDLY